MMNSPVVRISTRRFVDSRGWFSETYSEARLAEMGINVRFVQDNHSMSTQAGTVRGIHFQAPPYAQAKLVKCLKGSIMDYAVDLRSGSPTYGQWASALLSAENGDQLYIPVGFGHAFMTLVDDVEVAYKVSALYSPASEGGIRWDDPSVAIDFPLDSIEARLSDKDAILPLLESFDSPFKYAAGDAPLTIGQL